MSSIPHIPSPARTAPSAPPAHPFKRGDVVASNDSSYPLRSGGEEYPWAVVVQAHPMVLVSERADMRWESTVKPASLRLVGTASPNLLARCIARL